MNILVIGNGLDLAHNLPTTYVDFLNFIKVIQGIIRKNKPMHNWTILDERINIMIRGKIHKSRLEDEDEWKNLIENNIWIKYFNKISKGKNGNWVDFEKEISIIIKSLDNDMFNEVGKKVNIDSVVNSLRILF